MARSPLTWLVIVTLAAVPLYLGFVLYANWDEVAGALADFPWLLLLPVMLVNLAAHGVRALRWNYFLGQLGVRVTPKEGLLLYFAGLSMQLTPALLSGAVRVWLIKVKEGTGVSRTLPVIVAERLTDLLGLMMVALVGILTFGFGYITLSLVSLTLAVLVLLLRRPQPLLRFLDWLRGRRPKSRFITSLEEGLGSAYELLNPRAMVTTTTLSLVSWTFTWLAFYILLQGFRVDLDPATTCFIFAFPAVLGLVSQIPGGLGAEEGGAVTLLVMKGTLLATATAAVLIFRMATLWFSIVVGLVALVWFQRTYLGSAPLEVESQRGQ